MDDTDKVLHVIYVGIFVANFLLNTSGDIKAIEFLKECLVLLNSKALKSVKKLTLPIYIQVCFQIFDCYADINDHARAIECGKKLQLILRECSEKEKELIVTCKLAHLYYRQSKYKEAQQLYEEALRITVETGDTNGEGACYANLGTVFLSVSKYAKAKEYLQKALAITKNIGDKAGEATSYGNLATVFLSVGKYAMAEDYLQKALAIRKEIGDKEGGASDYGNLGTVFLSVGKYDKAEKYLQKALAIRKEIRDKEGEASDYGSLGTVSLSLGKYAKAEEYLQKALAIKKEIGDKAGEATSSGNLATVFLSVGKYAKAEEYLQKALAIRKEIGDKEGEATDYGNLGTMFSKVGKYAKAEEYLQKALAIQKEICDKAGEANSYGNLATVFSKVGKYAKAEEYLQKALAIRKEICDKVGEATSYGNLGTVFSKVGKYAKAEEYLQKALAIKKEIGDKAGEATSYGNLATVFLSVGKYAKAEEYLQKALAIRKEIGNKEGEATDYGNLGTMFSKVGIYAKAEEYLQKALAIRKEIGDKAGEALDYENLGAVFLFVGKYAKAEEYLQKALAIRKEIGDKAGEATSYGNLGTVFSKVGKYAKAEEYLRKALAIKKEIGDKAGEATSYENLGTVFYFRGDYAKGKRFHEKALEISYEIGHIELQFSSHLKLTFDTLLLGGSMLEASLNLFASIQKCEEMRDFLRDNDQFKISFFEERVSPYYLLSSLFCATGNQKEALYLVELGRARALADLMSAQYCVEKDISINPLSWFGIENIMEKNSNCTCLYISYFQQDIMCWILNANNAIIFRKKQLNDCIGYKDTKRSVDDVFGNQTFRIFRIFHQEQFEDRSLFSSYASQLTRESSQKDNLTAWRLVEKAEDKTQDPEVPTLVQCYNMIIAPVADLLKEPEIIFVPDRSLYTVPFAALTDESGKYLSDTFRIRIVPSLTTLKLIQNSPEDYHGQTGALIVGEPAVSEVYFKGKREILNPLPSARKEAEMIGRLLGVKPLLGKHATKQAVLQSIHSVSLIHIAAHGDAERGEIALAPSDPTCRIPREEDYLLTMAEISKVRLTAKLVVLSCCHSARGEIKAEGVVGIARAFLGSGARSVLVALWAIEDKATEQFMSRFYEHLIRGESASESLHRAMKWMRDNGFPELRQWAPFMLIGDNVTFNFGK